MPRKARIDAPGALHHIIARGIERRNIFNDDDDKDSFLERLATILKESKTDCFAWALLPNHFHLLLRTGDKPLASVMRRLLTGHAVTFNLRHNRQGHLFQNRYKSILCQEDSYLLELVRYIHLNPYRAGLVSDFRSLENYPYVGHGVLTGRFACSWHNDQFVLRHFAEDIKTARLRYASFVQKGVDMGNRPDLIGGGLVRSAGGWEGVNALRRSGDYQKGDERILGDGEFVQSVLGNAAEPIKKKDLLKQQKVSFDDVVARVAKLFQITSNEVLMPGRYSVTVRSRSLLCHWAKNELGMSQAELARRLKISEPAVSKAVRRGYELAKKSGWKLIG